MSGRLPPGLSLRAFGYKDAGKEKEAAAGVWESRAKRELTCALEWGEGRGRGWGHYCLKERAKYYYSTERSMNLGHFTLDGLCQLRWLLYTLCVF